MQVAGFPRSFFARQPVAPEKLQSVKYRVKFPRGIELPRRPMLPEVDRVLFKNAPLRLVIGQVRFPLLLRFNEGPFIAPFQDALASEYPVVSREQQVSFQV